MNDILAQTVGFAIALPTLLATCCMNDDTELTADSLTNVLVADVICASRRIDQEDTATHRREVVRAVFAAIEGLHWQLKEDIYHHARNTTDLSDFEKAALFEQSYTVDGRGNVHVQPRFVPIIVGIRLTIRIVRRYRPKYVMDFSHVGWANLQAAVKVRNRLSHPKRLADMEVTDAELKQAFSGFYWFLALVIEVLRQTNDHAQHLVGSIAEPAGHGAQIMAHPPEVGPPPSHS
jgi:hypothetical protein